MSPINLSFHFRESGKPRVTEAWEEQKKRNNKKWRAAINVKETENGRAFKKFNKTKKLVLQKD